MSINYNAVSEVANRTFQEAIADQVSRSNPVLKAITKKGVASDRIYIKNKVASNHEAGSHPEGADITFTGNEATTRASAVLDWKTYKSQFSVSKLALSALADNPGMLGSLLQDEIDDAALDLADAISVDLFAQGGADSISAIPTMIDDGNVYAGIDRATVANWRSTVVDNSAGGGTPGEISTDILFQADDAFFATNRYGLRDNGAGRQFVGFCTPGVLTKYSQLFTSINLTDLSTAHFVNQANDTGNLGKTTAGWMGIPIMRDAQALSVTGDDAGSGRLYFLDMSQVCMATLAPSKEAAIHQALGAMAAPTVDNLRFEVEILGNKGETVQGYIKTYIQLFTKSPKRAGLVVKNIAV